jgi:hypothetical protein
MTKVFHTLVLIALVGLATGAQARQSCWPNNIAINQVVTLDHQLSLALPVKDLGYPEEESRTVLKVQFSEAGGFDFTMKFRDSFEPLGHPQNVYALMILNEKGQAIFFEDFTGGCKGPGLSFFPKQELDLLFLKSSIVHEEKIHILLWSQ